jgi:hypothetical protein
MAHPRGARGGAAMRELSAGAREIIALSARLSPWIPAGACARASRWLDPSTGMSGAWCSHEPQTPLSCAGLTRASMVSRHKAHSYSRHCGAGSWIAGSSPAMTTERQCVQFHSVRPRASGDPVQAVTTREIIRWIPELSRPHGEERRAAARLEPWGRPILRDASLRDAPQDEADRPCEAWIPAGACARASRWLDPSTGTNGARCTASASPKYRTTVQP